MRVCHDAVRHRPGAGFIVAPAMHVGERLRRQELSRNDEAAGTDEEATTADIFENDARHVTLLSRRP